MLTRRTAAAVAALVVLSVATVVVVAVDDDPPPRAASSGYRIVYRVEDRTETPPRVTTEVVEVARPFRSRRSTRPGEPPGGASTGGSITTEDGVYVIGTDGVIQQVAAVLAGEPGSDLRLTTSLASAERRGLARRDGTGTVLGQMCTWWLTRGPLDTETMAASTATDRARSCVDASGRLLEEDWSPAGQSVRRRRAIQLEAAPDLAGATIFGDATPRPVPDQLRTTVVQPAERPEWLHPPPGHRVRQVARGVEFDPNESPPQPQRITVRTVFSSDRDVTVVDVVDDLRGDGVLGAGAEIALGSNRTGRLRATPAGLVLELLTGERLVRIRSSLPEDVLVGWFSGLTPS